MRPAVVILGFIMGSAAAITFALAGTAIVFTFLRSEYPRLDGELPSLLLNVALFGLLTTAAASSFYGEIKHRSWRYAAWGVMLLALAAVTAYHTWL